MGVCIYQDCYCGCLRHLKRLGGQKRRSWRGTRVLNSTVSLKSHVHNVSVVTRKLVVVPNNLKSDY
jgi:hypothetical protein